MSEGGRPASGPDYPVPDAPDWEILDSVVEYENSWYIGGYDLVKQPDGSEKRYYWAELPPAVVVVARSADDVVMVEQYRPAVRETHLELPAGIVERGESYTAAGQRELREETGFDPGSTALLGDYWATTGLLRHRRAIVFADGLEPVEIDRDSNEFLQVTSVPIEDLIHRVSEQPSHDATLEGVLLAHHHGLLER
ncbi:MAG: NUDIX hydrolase [Salinirussus sp.]